MEQLKCERVVTIDLGRDAQGKPVTAHEKCGLPASETEITGLLTTAKAILCDRHRRAAEDQDFVSQNGFPKGKIDPKAKADGYQQVRMKLR